MADIEFNMNDRYKWTIPDIPYIVKKDNKITTEIPSDVDIAFDRHFVDTTVRGLVESYQTCVAIYAEMSQLVYNPQTNRQGNNYWEGNNRFRQNQENNIDLDHANKMNFTNPHKEPYSSGTRIANLNSILNDPDGVREDNLESILDYYRTYNSDTNGGISVDLSMNILNNGLKAEAPAYMLVDAFRDANSSTKFPARTDGQSYNQPIKLEWFARLRENLINTSNFFIKNNGKFYDNGGFCVIGCQVNCQSTCQLTCQHRQLGDDFLNYTKLERYEHAEIIKKLGWPDFRGRNGNESLNYYDPWGRIWRWYVFAKQGYGAYYLGHEPHDNYWYFENNIGWYPGAPFDRPAGVNPDGSIPTPKRDPDYDPCAGCENR